MRNSERSLIVVFLTGHELTGAERVNGVEMEMKPVSACEQAITDVLQSLSELNVVKPGKPLQVRM